LRQGTPELAINRGMFECFRCGARGDVVGLVKLARKCDLETAIAWLASETARNDPSSS
jgi:DNA primase